MRRPPLTSLIVCTLFSLTARAEPPAPAAPDTSTPKAAARAFFKAMQDGDAAAVKALAVGTDKQLATLDVLTPIVNGFKLLEVAAIKRFGDDGRKHLSQGATRPGFNFNDELATATETIAGDTATIVAAADKARDPMKLKKIDGRWRMDMSDIHTEVLDNPAALAKLRLMAAAAKSTALEIEQDKYKTAEEAKAALNEKLKPTGTTK